MKVDISEEDIRSISKRVLDMLGGRSASHAAISIMRKTAEEATKNFAYQAKDSIQDELHKVIESKIRSEVTTFFICEICDKIIKEILEKNPDIIKGACISAIEEKFKPEEAAAEQFD